MATKYTKEQIYQMLDSGKSYTQLNCEYGIGGNTLTRYKQLRERGGEFTQSNSHIITPQTGGVSSILIGDIHAPFMHPDAFYFVKELRNKYKPRNIIFAGDEIDAHAMGRFPKDPDGYSAGGELQKAIECLIPFYKEFPNAMVCESNHTVRAYKKAFENEIPSAFLREIEKVLNAPDGWKWAEHWIVDDVLYIHGDPYHGRNAAIKHMHENFMSVGMGHTHSYGRAEHYVTRWKRFFA